MMRNRLLLIIITFGRETKRIVTHKSLRRFGYTGDIAFVMSNDDTKLDENKRALEREGYEVFVYNRDEVLRRYDNHTNTTLLSPGHARAWICDNGALWAARGYEFVAIFDDDYVDFCDSSAVRAKRIELDSIFDLMCDFLRESGAVVAAFAQSGDFLGKTIDRVNRFVVRRKVMNTFFMPVDKMHLVKWRSGLNEDVSTSIHLAMRGMLALTLPQLSMHQYRTQKVSGGLTEWYKRYNTYVKSAMSAMLAPRAVKIVAMGWTYPRPHHEVEWDKIAPLVVSDKYRKQ